MHHPTDRIEHTTAVSPFAKWVARKIYPMTHHTISEWFTPGLYSTHGILHKEC